MYMAWTATRGMHFSSEGDGGDDVEWLGPRAVGVDEVLSGEEPKAARWGQWQRPNQGRPVVGAVRSAEGGGGGEGGFGHTLDASKRLAKGSQVGTMAETEPRATMAEQ